MLGSGRRSSVTTRAVSMKKPKLTAKKKQGPAPPQVLKGWQQISALLGEPASVVQRWASKGMPVRKQGRYVDKPDELNAWLGKGSGKPVHTRRDRFGRRVEAGLVVCSGREQTCKSKKVSRSKCRQSVGSTIESYEFSLCLDPPHTR